MSLWEQECLFLVQNRIYPKEWTNLTLISWCHFFLWWKHINRLKDWHHIKCLSLCLVALLPTFHDDLPLHHLFSRTWRRTWTSGRPSFLRPKTSTKRPSGTWRWSQMKSTSAAEAPSWAPEGLELAPRATVFVGTTSPALRWSQMEYQVSSRILFRSVRWM